MSSDEVAAMFWPVLISTPLILFIGCSALRGPHHPKDHHHHSPQEGSPKLTQDTALLRDAKHIQEDLNNLVAKVQAEKMTTEEMEFHYFKLHDFDNNTKLDGLEILQAIRHSTEYDELKPINTSKPHEHDYGKQMDFFIGLIDKVLEEDDLNGDGYLSYSEYVVGRQRDQPTKN